MKVAVITSIKTPYRKLQFEEICNKNKNIDMSVYYTSTGNSNRDWKVENSKIFKEVYLDRIKYFEKLGNLNKGLKDIVKSNDIIVLGGYEKPTYILMSILCRFYNKKYIIIFDGISCNRLNQKENKFKWLIKNIVIKHSYAIWGNGTVSKEYFTKFFKYPNTKIYNQYLTVDGDSIKKMAIDKLIIRQELRRKYKINEEDKVLHYSGRLSKEKNIESIIKAISKLKDKNITLFITGDGVLRETLEEMAKQLDVKLIITGFIDNQEYLFKHYYISDAFILPSINEVWGLVVNEAMFAGLPVLVSNICGCSLDLVENKENGYLIDPYNIDDISQKIKYIFEVDNIEIWKEKSRKIIEEFSFDNSAKSFNSILEDLI